jgi:hypothetical protein
MSHYTMSYKGLSPVEADAKALADTRDYLGPKAWEALLFEVGRANGYDAANGGHAGWAQILIALSFCGVQGYPVHAIGRCYCLEAYKDWMVSGDEPVAVDAKGFPDAHK